jgi:hypothetical protein
MTLKFVKINKVQKLNKKDDVFYSQCDLLLVYFHKYLPLAASFNIDAVLDQLLLTLIIGSEVPV